MDQGLAGGLVREPVDGMLGHSGGFVTAGGILGKQHLFVAGKRWVIGPAVGRKKLVRGQQVDRVMYFTRMNGRTALYKSGEMRYTITDGLAWNSSSRDTEPLQARQTCAAEMSSGVRLT